jgi:Icc protein
MRIVQLSDPHIVAPEKQPVLGKDTLAHLRHAVAAVNGLTPAPSFVVLTGDLTNDEQPVSYALARGILADLQAPCHMALGNHDARVPFRQTMLGETAPQPERYYYTFRREGYRFIVLDSLDEGQVSGCLDEAQLRWLESTLAAAPDAPTVLCMHHPPVPIGVPWLDALMLRNPEPLFALLDACPCVRLVLCGHVHQSACIERNHFSILTSPALSVQFRQEPLPPPAERPQAIVSPDPPAFRIVDLREGAWATALYPITIP